jgi:hypothetical protein
MLRHLEKRNRSALSKAEKQADFTSEAIKPDFGSSISPRITLIPRIKEIISVGLLELRRKKLILELLGYPRSPTAVFRQKSPWLYGFCINGPLLLCELGGLCVRQPKSLIVRENVVKITAGAWVERCAGRLT